MSKITDLVTPLAEPIVTAQGCSLWDVEYLKEAGGFFLRIYIDKPDGISIQDCEAVSRALSDVLDDVDPIQDPYTFEVSSAGADRVLKKPAHFLAFLGAEVDCKRYKPKDGCKDFSGILTAYEKDSATFTVNAESVTVQHKELAQVRLHVSF